MFNTYTEEFRRNVVAVVRSGYGILTLAKRLNIPPTSIRNWMEHPKYKDVKPANEEIIAQLPEKQEAEHGLVMLSTRTVKHAGNLPVIKIKIGNAEIETPENTSAESFRLLIESLRAAHVL